VNHRAERLTYIQKELQVIRHDPAKLAGSDRLAEVRMVDDLACAIAMLIKDAKRPRSGLWVSGNPPAPVLSALRSQERGS
jgi:hypothetical protein